MLKRLMSVFLSLLFLYPPSLLAQANNTIDTYMFRGNNGGMLKSQFDYFSHLSEEEIKNTYHKDHPIWRYNDVRPVTEIRNAGFLSDLEKKEVEVNKKPGRYFRVVQDSKGETYRRIIFKQFNPKNANFEVKHFDVPFGDYEHSAFKPTKFRQTFRDPKYVKDVTVNLFRDTFLFALAGISERTFTNSFAGAALKGPDYYNNEIINSGVVPSEVKNFFSDITNFEKLILGESLFDPMFIENEILRLKDPHGWVHFGSFIAINRAMSDFSKFYTPETNGAGNPKNLNRFDRSMVKMGRNTFFNMGVASIGASMVTEVGFGIYNCTLPKVIKLSYGLVEATDEEIQQKLHECDRVLEEAATGKVFERWFYDTVFAMLPAVVLSHTVQSLITLKAFANMDSTYAKTRSRLVSTKEGIKSLAKKAGLSKSASNNLARAQSTLNLASSNLDSGLTKRAQVLQSVSSLRSRLGTKVSENILAQAMKTHVSNAGYALKFQKVKGVMSWGFYSFKGIHQSIAKFMMGGAIRRAGVQTFGFFLFLAAMNRTKYYAVPFEVWKHSRHIDAATIQLKSDIEGLLGYGPMNQQALSNARNSIKTDSKKIIKEDIYLYGRMHEDWRNYLLADSNMAYTNWLKHIEKITQKYDAAKFFYSDVVEKIAGYMSDKPWSEYSQPVRDALQTYPKSSDKQLFYYFEVAPRSSSGQSASGAQNFYDLESRFPREDMAKGSRYDQNLKRLTVIRNQLDNFKSDYQAADVEDIELKQDAEKIILGLGRDPQKVINDFVSRGNSKQQALTNYYKSLNKTLLDLNTIVSEKAPDILTCMNGQQNSDNSFSYCNFVLLHFGLGSPGHIGQRYVENMARVMSDPSGKIRSRDDYREEVVGAVYTKNMAEYLLAQSVCGPDATKRYMPKNISSLLFQAYDLDTNQKQKLEVIYGDKQPSKADVFKNLDKDKLEKIKSCYADSKRQNGGIFDTVVNLFSFEERTLGEDNNDLTDCIRTTVPEFERNDMFRNLRGISLDFEPPRLVSKDMSYICNQLEEASKYDFSKTKDNSPKLANVHHWVYKYIYDGDGEEYTATSLIKVLMYSINKDILDFNGEGEVGSLFESWWDKNVTPSYKQRLAEAHFKYKAIVDYIIKPTFFGSKNSSEFWNPDSKNRWSSENAESRGSESFYENDWNRHHQYGVLDSLAIELNFYLDDVLKPLMKKSKDKSWNNKYSELKNNLYTSIDSYVFQQVQFENDQESNKNKNLLLEKFQMITKDLTALLKHLGLNEYSKKFNLNPDMNTDGHSLYNEDDVAMEKQNNINAGVNLSEVQKIAVDQTVKNMIASVLMLSSYKDLLVRLDMTSKLGNPSAYFERD